MKNGNVFVSELSTSRHAFHSYHFCRGNNSKRKTRIGIIEQGRGTYIYLNKKLSVTKGDIVFIPENIYCYSEWFGEPDIEVTYINCFLHYDTLKYEPQILGRDEDIKQALLRISALLSGDDMDELEAYSLFYRALQSMLPLLAESNVAFNKTLQTAIEYITGHWDQSFGISDVAKACCVSESTLYHLFQKELGQTPIGFLHSIRINVAIEHLDNSNYSVSTIASLVGFHSENHFRRVFYELTGTTPLKYRKSK
jgi:AraC-like DNA-binding protein